MGEESLETAEVWRSDSLKAAQHLLLVCTINFTFFFYSSKLNKMSKAGEGHLKRSLRNDGSGLLAPTNTSQTTASAFISKKK